MSPSTQLRSVLSRCAPEWLRRWRASRSQRALEAGLPPFAGSLIASDRQGLLASDYGAETAVRQGLEWLLLAQQCSATNDGGVARHFSLLDGWAASYPETTGYIVPTLLREGRSRKDPRLIDSARAMVDWLLSIQFPDGGFQGGVIGEQPRVPVTFNTGQILLGLAAAANHFKRPDCLAAMRRAADWLVATQDADGCWRKHGTPFAEPGEKAYETHVAWGLFEADRLDPSRGYGGAGMRQVEWALTCQLPNGWFEKCCLSDVNRPLTHTLGYALRGLLEAHRWRPSSALFDACQRTGRSLLACVDERGRLPGRLTREWQPAAEYICLTGSVQIAHCWMMLYELTQDASYLTAARRVNSFVRCTLVQGTRPEIAGAVRGSYPVSGEYGQYQFLNWAAKFMVDANSKELEMSRPVTDFDSGTSRTDN